MHHFDSAAHDIDGFVTLAKEAGPCRGFQWICATRLPETQIIIHHVRDKEKAQAIVADGFTEGCYGYMSHLTQRQTRKDDRKGPFAFRWSFSRSMALRAFAETNNRHSYGDFALVLQSSHAAEAYNCADSQYQVLFERKHVRILGVIEAYLGDCFALYDPAWNWLTSTEVSWKTLRRHVEKLAASKAAVLV